MLTEEELHSMGGGPGKLKDLPIGHPYRLNWIYERFLKKDLSEYTTDRRMPLEATEKPVDAFKYVEGGNVPSTRKSSVQPSNEV